MNLRLRANDLILKTLVCFSMTLILSHAQAAEEPANTVEDYRTAHDLVELHYPIEIDAPYKDRRNTNGFMFGLTYENVMLDRYVSVIDKTSFYQDLFGETEFPVYNLNLSYKYNFALGSLAANFGIGYGTIEEGPAGAVDSLTLTKYMASATYTIDNFLEEPYLAPYGTVGLMSMALEEKSPTKTAHGNLDMLMFMQAGVLIQLNWLDEDVARRSLRDFGLQNTYLDLFVSKYDKSSVAGDPDTSTDMMYGAGVRLEY